MQFTSHGEMIDFLAACGIDLTFSDSRVWGESPQVLFHKHLIGEVTFGFLPETGALATFSERLRVQIFTPSEILYEVGRRYPSGKLVTFIDETKPLVPTVGKDHWSLSESIRKGEPMSETEHRMFRQEMGLDLSCTNLLQPLGAHLLAEQYPLGIPVSIRRMLEVPTVEAARPSTIYPFMSVVTTHWREIALRDREQNAAVLSRNDEDVFIHRTWFPR